MKGPKYVVTKDQAEVLNRPGVPRAYLAPWLYLTLFFGRERERALLRWNVGFIRCAYVNEERNVERFPQRLKNTSLFGGFVKTTDGWRIGLLRL